MSILLIPIAPLHKSKSRLQNCLSREQIEELTIAMFKDLGNILLKVDCFSEKIVYCESPEILEIASDYNLVGIKEETQKTPIPFDHVITNMNKIIMNKYDAEATVISFLDLILISAKNFYEINSLVETNQMVVCPTIKSAGISVLGRRPPEIISSCFSSPDDPSLIALFQKARESGIKDISIYDSFRASFDVDIQEDLILGYEYLKIFNLTHTKTFKFLKNNLKFSLQKANMNNNREFRIINE